MLSKLLNRGVENSGNSMDLRLTTRIGAAWAQLQPTLPNYATLQQHECGNPGAWAHLLLTFVDVPALSPKEWFLVLRSCARSRGGGWFCEFVLPRVPFLGTHVQLGRCLGTALGDGATISLPGYARPRCGVACRLRLGRYPDQRLCLYT